MSNCVGANVETCQGNNMNSADVNKTLDLGNNESISRGIYPQGDGTYLAMTYTQSKYFKTLKGAQKWFARKTNRPATVY